MGGPAPRFFTIFHLESPFFDRIINIWLEVAGFGRGLVGFVELASNTGFAALQTLSRVVFMPNCPFGDSRGSGFVVRLRELGPQFFGELVVVMKLQKVIDEVLVDILRLRLHVKLLKKIEYFKLLVSSAVWHEIRMIFFLQKC